MKRILFYGFWCFAIILIGQLPILLHVWHAPGNTYYPYLDTIAPSDYYYPAIIRFGMGPDWLTKIPYTTIDHQGSLIQILFILLGKLAIVFHIGPNEIFAISRVAGGLILLFAVIHLVHSCIEQPKRKLAFLFILFSQPFPFSLNLPQEFFGKWTWHFGEAARRMSSMPPHYTIGKGLALLSLSFFLRFEKNNRKMDYVFSLASAVIGGIIYPAPIFILLFSLVLAWFIELSIQFFHKKQIHFKTKLPFIIFCLFLVLPLLLLKYELLKGFPWSMWNKVELGWNDPKIHFGQEYFHMLGIYIFFLPVAFYSFVKKNSKTFFDYFIWIWCVSGYILFPFANLLQLGKFRFTEGVQIVPLSFLVLQSYYFIVDALKKLNDKLSKFASVSIVVFIFINFLIFTSASTYSSTMDLWKPWGNVYLINYETDALHALDTSAQKNEIVMADSSSSNYIPVFARVRTILGFSDLYDKFWDFQLEEDAISSILMRKATESVADAYLKKKKISFIYYQKYIYGNETLYPSLLEKIYSNQYYEVYKVR